MKIFYKILKSTLPTTSGNWQEREIFDLRFFSSQGPIWASVYPLKLFQIWFLRSYLILNIDSRLLSTAAVFDSPLYNMYSGKIWLSIGILLQQDLLKNVAESRGYLLHNAANLFLQNAVESQMCPLHFVTPRYKMPWRDLTLRCIMPRKDLTPCCMMQRGDFCTVSLTWLLLYILLADVKCSGRIWFPPCI